MCYYCYLGLEFPWTMSSIVVAQGLGLPLPPFISANLFFTLVKVAYMKSSIKILQSFMAHSFLPNIIYVQLLEKFSHTLDKTPQQMTKAMTLFLLVLKALMGRSSCRINSEPLKFEKTGCRSQFFPHPSNIKMISSRGISARHREHLICHLSSPLGNFWRNDSSRNLLKIIFFKDFQSGLVLGKHCRLWPNCFHFAWFRKLSTGL